VDCWDAQDLRIPTLEDVLKRTPAWLGINVEVKYPISSAVEHLGFSAAFELNSYLGES
jgi:hypothetical protein